MAAVGFRHNAPAQSRMAIPRAETRFYQQPHLWLCVAEEVIAVGAAAIGAATATKYLADAQPGLSALVAAATLAVVVFQVVKSVIQFKVAKRTKSLHQLVGCLQTMKGVLEASSPEARDAGLRVTVYVPIENGNKLEQVCDYVSADPARCRGTAGRSLPATAGVIGRAFQHGKYAVASRIDGDAEAHISDLVNNWGFSKERARKVDPTVQSWMAVPLQTLEEGVEAIVFLDAQKPRFFTENRELLVLGGCLGLALFVRQRYT